MLAIRDDRMLDRYVYILCHFLESAFVLLYNSMLLVEDS